jgi:hypothetical protein
MTKGRATVQTNIARARAAVSAPPRITTPKFSSILDGILIRSGRSGFDELRSRQINTRSVFTGAILLE